MSTVQVWNQSNSIESPASVYKAMPPCQTTTSGPKWMSESSIYHSENIPKWMVPKQPSTRGSAAAPLRTSSHLRNPKRSGDFLGIPEQSMSLQQPNRHFQESTISTMKARQSHIKSLLDANSASWVETNAGRSQSNATRFPVSFAANRSPAAAVAIDPRTWRRRRYLPLGFG